MAWLLLPHLCAAQAADALKLTLTAQGVQSLTYKGVEYADPSGRGVVGFSGGDGGISDVKKSREACVQDTHQSRAAFPTTPTTATLNDSTVILTYSWGRLAVTYTIKGADLDIHVRLKNTSQTPIGYWNANLLQFNNRLVFDPTGKNMHWDYEQYRFGPSDPYAHWNFADPHVYWWNDGDTKILFADLDPKWRTGVDRLKTDGGDRWVVQATADNDEDSATTEVAPGATEAAHVVIRFRAATDDPYVIAADGFGAFARSVPMRVHWTDRRPIGTFFVAETGKGWTTNPNGWFNDPKLDVTTDAGRQEFARRLLQRVDDAIVQLKDTDAQGVIWWDVEGGRYRAVTYVGDPRVLDPAHPQHDKYAPEMDTEVTYNGKPMKLVDACFAKFRDAGFKVGVTIRPQALVWKDTGPSQEAVPNKNVETLPKAEYAMKRWGCTLFYVDSVADWWACWWYNALTDKYPNVLVLPEWARTRTFGNAAPFSYTKFTGWSRGTPPLVKACWPNAFCCLSNVDYRSPEARTDALAAVKQGDLLMFDCWFASDASRQIKAIYQQSGTKHTPVALDQTAIIPLNSLAALTLKATDEDGDKVSYSILEQPEHGDLLGLNPENGAVIYKPAQGYAGPDFFTFKATDATGLPSNRATVSITVGEARK